MWLSLNIGRADHRTAYIFMLVYIVRAYHPTAYACWSVPLAVLHISCLTFARRTSVVGHGLLAAPLSMVPLVLVWLQADNG